MISYDDDLLNLVDFNSSTLWAQWNMQPLDPMYYLSIPNDCRTPFGLQNVASGSILSYGAAYPDGFLNNIDYGSSANMVSHIKFLIKTMIIVNFSWFSIPAQIVFKILIQNDGSFVQVI